MGAWNGGLRIVATSRVRAPLPLGSLRVALSKFPPEFAEDRKPKSFYGFFPSSRATMARRALRGERRP